MKNFFTGLRALVYLRKIAIASERQALALETLARIEQFRWQAQQPKMAKPMVFGALNLDEAEKGWQRRRYGIASTGSDDETLRESTPGPGY
jgi:hypothetical protein